MTFLEAKRVAAGFSGGEPLPFLLAMSGAADVLDLFVRAAGAKRTRAARMQTLPFNTLRQHLASPPADVPEIWLLLPWDFVPEADWRSGLPMTPSDPSEVRARARHVFERLAARHGAALVYLPAPHLPLFAEPTANASLASWLASEASALGASRLPERTFALGTYLASGCPIAAHALGDVAGLLVSLAEHAAGPKKLLVTDFDNVLWSGVIGEDGLAGIVCTPEGRGFRHFVYQTLLIALRSEGTLIAGVSRNDSDDALAPFRSGATVITESDFVATIASYHPKSVQIRTLAERLNLGLDSVVFVDDNPVELAEVAAALPEVVRVPFPASDDEMPAFFDRLRALFGRRAVTAEDRDRTVLYRRRATGLAPVDGDGADLGDFLRALDMRLTIYDRTNGDHERALQLINKTNQFNINGRRLTEADLERAIGSGARLYTAALSDRTGTHGEILSCVISAERVVESLVLSCRVFQRRVEHAFVAWLGTHNAPVAFRLIETPRNEPARQFFCDPAFPRRDETTIAFDAPGFAARHQDAVVLCGVTAS